MASDTLGKDQTVSWVVSAIYQFRALYCQPRFEPDTHKAHEVKQLNYRIISCAQSSGLGEQVLLR